MRPWECHGRKRRWLLTSSHSLGRDRQAAQQWTSIIINAGKRALILARKNSTIISLRTMIVRFIHIRCSFSHNEDKVNAQCLTKRGTSFTRCVFIRLWWLQCVPKGEELMWKQQASLSARPVLALIWNSSRGGTSYVAPRGVHGAKVMHRWACQEVFGRQDLCLYRTWNSDAPA